MGFPLIAVNTFTEQVDLYQYSLITTPSLQLLLLLLVLLLLITIIIY